MPQKYLVTRASIYAVRPIITEHHVQVIEEARPPKRGLGPPSRLEKFVSWVIGIPLGIWLDHWLVNAICGCQ